MESSTRSVPKGFVAEPYGYHEEVELRVDDLSNLGVGVGRIDGWVVMVPFALPGERVRARIWCNHKNYSEADLVEVLEASPERVEPQCGLFGACGGCQYQHLAYEAQLKWKQRQVRELFARLAGVEVMVEATHASPQTYGYRSKLTPHYKRPRPDRPTPVGFLRVNGSRIVDVPQCPIATETINAALPAARARIQAGGKEFRRGGTLLLRDTMEGVVTDMREVVLTRVGAWTFQFVAGEFFQNNPYILPEFIKFIVEEAAVDGAQFLVDAYSGVGVFAIAGAERFERVQGVEVSAPAVKLAHGNARMNGVTNAEFLIGSAEEIFAKVEFPGEASAVILDPPRRGAEEAFLRQLVTFAPARVVYVSCEPSTQARDAKYLLGHGYELVRLRPFDLFPQTRHIESVAVFRRTGQD